MNLRKKGVVLIEPRILCIVGIGLIIFGVWLKATIYWDTKNSPAYEEKLKNTKLKIINHENITVWERFQRWLRYTWKHIQKITILLGTGLVIIGCILKSLI